MAPAVRTRAWQTLVFRGATAVALLHALDDAFLNRQPGVPLDQHWLAAFLALAVGVAAIIAFPRLRPGLRAAIAIVFGVLAFVNGILHAIQIREQEGAANSDVTGVLAVAAGAILVLLGLAMPFVHRGEGAATRGRRWANRVIAIVAGALVLYVFLVPFSAAIVQTHKYREAIGEPPPGYEPVTFRSSDGLELAGWYRPSTNGAAVIVVHGGGGDRAGSLAHAALLARHGYGALAYDSRGRGESEGSHIAYGWGWENDVEGALDFLRERADVEEGRIGGLGLSTGAEVLVEVAPEHRELKTVVSDGLTARSFADFTAVQGIDVTAPFVWTFITGSRVLSGASPGPPLEELVPRVSPTPLFLISAGKGGLNEREFNLHYAEVAREPFELWNLPDVNHTAAIRERPQEYERRVVGFFDRALLRGRG
jgi:hypothetical protein